MANVYAVVKNYTAMAVYSKENDAVTHAMKIRGTTFAVPLDPPIENYYRVVFNIQHGTFTTFGVERVPKPDGRKVGWFEMQERTLDVYVAALSDDDADLKAREILVNQQLLSKESA